MFAYMETLKRYTPLLRELIHRDVKLKYRRSALGFLWTILNPLLMMTVLSIVFSQLFRFQVDNYALYLLAGQLIFGFFSEATTLSMTSIINNASLIKKIYVPKYLFTVSKVFSSAINVFSSFLALVIVMLLTGATFHWTIILAVVPLFLLVLLALGVSLMMSSLTVRFRDLMYLYSVFLTVLNYLTPIIYPIDILPDYMLTIVRLNPLTTIVDMFRSVVIYGQVFNVATLIYGVLTVGIVLVLGSVTFYKQQDTFILYL